MRTMLLAAAAGLSLAASTVAYADGGQGTEPNTLFTQLPGVLAQADVPNASAYAQNRQAQPQQGTTYANLLTSGTLNVPNVSASECPCSRICPKSGRPVCHRRCSCR